MTDLRSAKAAARAAARRAREEAACRLPEAAAALRDRFLAAVRVPAGTVVAGYWPIGTEMDPRPILDRLAEAGVPCALPVAAARGRSLVFRRWTPGAPLAPGLFDVPEPAADVPQVRPTLVLVPMLAFDRAGHRLGYGAGFYDRTLEELRRAGPVRAVGVAYAAQEMPAVPCDGHDQPLDLIVTESDVLRLTEPEDP